jgi:very-short-patch-repair endonuclease
MRRLFTTAEARTRGLTDGALRWGERTGRWRRVERGVYGDGPHDPGPIDAARARVMAAGSVARGRLAGVLHELDVVTLDGLPRRHRGGRVGNVVQIAGIPCADGLQTILDLAADLDDLRWEQALESALRKSLTTIRDLERALPALSRARTIGTRRVRRVLALRPPNAAPTGSLLETLMVQLVRDIELPNPIRQHIVVDVDDCFVARVDLCWPDYGAFIELDGQQHQGQPVYDARRETAVVAATGWLPGRFTWHEVVHLPRSTGRRLIAVLEQARRRNPGLSHPERILGR